VEVFRFQRPDFTWNSTRQSLSTAVAAIDQLAGFGFADAIIGGQYGSEGKGKLAALLAPGYGALVRSGGPNAGHWVRTEHWEYCYHHLPSGSRAAPEALVMMAAGASIWPDKFWEEVQANDLRSRLVVDRNAIIIEQEDRDTEAFRLVESIGSTAQGV